MWFASHKQLFLRPNVKELHGARKTSLATPGVDCMYILGS